MRVNSQSIEQNYQSTSLKNVTNSISNTVTKSQSESNAESKVKKIEIQSSSSKNANDTKEVVTTEKLQEAVNSINEFLQTQQKSSKFILHDGLDKYYVRLVDAETDEVIKEIPPEKLLNAFYEMQKLAGMIVDEKI